MECEHWKHLAEEANRRMLAMERERKELRAKAEEMRHQWLDRANSTENFDAAMTLRTRAEGIAYVLALLDGETS